MPVLCLGLNHKTAPVELRERVAFRESEVAGALGELRSRPGIDGVVVVSTCNRVEVYGSSGGGSGGAGGTEEIRRFLLGHFGLEESAMGAFYERSGEAAQRHLLRVVSGLDSMVVGETEIFGQVKQAYAVALGEKATSKELNQLFQRAFSVGKLVRTSTQITNGATSVGAVAVDLAGKIFGELSDCRVMILGAGEMSRRCAASLKSRGATGLVVSNRSYDRAVELAAEIGGEAVHFDDWENWVGKVDIVIASTSAPHPVVHRKQVEALARRRRGAPLFFIDIAVPRDVEPEVGDVDGVYLYDIDALEAIASEGREQRAAQVAACEGIIDRELERWRGEAGAGGRRGRGRGGEPRLERG